MTNHPNRSKFRHPAKRPDPAMIEAARKAQRLTQKSAADKVYATESAWRAWESGERPMHAGIWELFKLKTFDREVLRALGLMAAPGPPPGESSEPHGDGYYWVTYPDSEPEIVRVLGPFVEGFWSCESSLEDLRREGARFFGPLDLKRAPAPHRAEKSSPATQTQHPR